MTSTKTIFWSLSRQTVFLQNLFNHIRLLFCCISDACNNFFQKNFTFACLFNFYWISPDKVRFAQVLAFSKIAKIEGEVFVALRASQGDLEPSRATISPQSPCSLTPEKSITSLSSAEITHKVVRVKHLLLPLSVKQNL